MTVLRVTTSNNFLGKRLYGRDDEPTKPDKFMEASIVAPGKCPDAFSRYGFANKMMYAQTPMADAVAQASNIPAVIAARSHKA